MEIIMADEDVIIDEIEAEPIQTASGANREAETSVNATMTIREIDNPGNTFSFTVIFDAFVY
jgi:hypothetical protein